MINDGTGILTPELSEDDLVIEGSLRPKSLDDYIGQEKTKEKLRIFIQAAKMRNESLDHVVLYGPPGLGKTTLSGIIANELGVKIKITSGPAIERPGDLAAVLSSLSENDVLFIDEIHRLPRHVEEVLYPAMEDFCLDIIIGKGSSARSIRVDLPKFTLVGATTRLGMLSSPLRDRFGVICKLDLYSGEDLTKIVKRSADILDIFIEDDAANNIALRGRGTPRIVNRLLKRVRDFAQVKNKESIDIHTSNEAMDILEVDHLGLDHTDKKILLTIIEKFDGGPVGIDTLSAGTDEEKETIEDVYEPFLLQLGFLHRTPRGRVATKRAYEHLGLSALFEKIASENRKDSLLDILEDEDTLEADEKLI